MSDRDSGIDDLLKKFLIERPIVEQKAASALERIFFQLESHEQKDDSRHDVIVASLKGLDARITKIEDKDEETSSHDITALRQRDRDRELFVAKIWQGLIIAVVMLLAGAGFAKLIGK